jgi:hypothetical protein
MANTVGSFETKHWHKNWIPIKESLFLNKKQEDFIIGSLLGDGTMRIGEGAKNANLKIEHGLEQKKYVEWKYQILKPFVFTEPKLSYRYREDGEKYEKSWWFRTLRHPFFTQIYHQFYQGDGHRNGKKIIPKSLKYDLNPFIFAIWIMDDGSYSRGAIDISTYCFSLDEIQFLQECILYAFKIESKFYRDRDKGYRMYFSKQETRKVIDIICLHIIPSMKYKIGFETP